MSGYAPEYQYAYTGYATGYGGLSYYNGTAYTFYAGPRYEPPFANYSGTNFHGSAYFGAEYSVKLGYGAYANYSGPTYVGSSYDNGSYVKSHYSAGTYFTAYTPFGMGMDFPSYYYNGSGYGRYYGSYYGGYYGGYSPYGSMYSGQNYGSYYGYGYSAYSYGGSYTAP